MTVVHYLEWHVRGTKEDKSVFIQSNIFLDVVNILTVVEQRYGASNNTERHSLPSGVKKNNHTISIHKMQLSKPTANRVSDNAELEKPTHFGFNTYFELYISTARV